MGTGRGISPSGCLSWADSMLFGLFMGPLPHFPYTFLAPFLPCIWIWGLGLLFSLEKLHLLAASGFLEGSEWHPLQGSRIMSCPVPGTSLMRNRCLPGIPPAQSVSEPKALNPDGPRLPCSLKASPACHYSQNEGKKWPHYHPGG